MFAYCVSHSYTQTTTISYNQNNIASYPSTIPQSTGIVIRQVDAMDYAVIEQNSISHLFDSRCGSFNPFSRFTYPHISLSYTPGEIVHVTKFSDMSTVFLLTNSTAFFVQTSGTDSQEKRSLMSKAGAQKIERVIR
jgi:hypothetical protein